MTDQPQIHIDPTEGSQLRLKQAASPADAGKLFISVTGDNGVVATTYIPPAALLAMIDAADPEAMRAYLRETAPDFVADTLRPADGPAADHFDYLDNDTEPTGHTARATPEQLDQTPVADSPEDVDEYPGPAPEVAERFYLLQRVRDAYPQLQPRRHIAVVHWLLHGIEVPEAEVATLDGLPR